MDNSEDKLLFIENLKKRWMATVDAIRDPLMIVDREYKVKKANKALATLAKTTIKDVLEKKCYQVFANREEPCLGCSMLQGLENEKEQIFELEDARPERFHEVTAQPIYDSSGQAEGMVTIYRDRTEARALRNQLLQSEKLASIGLLAGGIAHEINNPLGGILIFSQMILREMKKDSSHYNDVVEIEAAAQRCKEIVESLLNFARMQPAKKAKKENVDMKNAIMSSLKFGTVGSGRPDVDIQENWTLKDHNFNGSRNKMIQLFLNLIQNALQAMPKGGTLTLGSKLVEQNSRFFACYEISDTGIGIQKEICDKIFDPFFTSKAQGEGTGLGLSICHGIVSEYEGRIEVESEVGEGTTFRVYFPLNQEPNSEAS